MNPGFLPFQENAWKFPDNMGEATGNRSNSLGNQLPNRSSKDEDLLSFINWSLFFTPSFP
jgi:hypothetical protein